MPRLSCPLSVVEATLTWLKAAGDHRRECVVLWLGQRQCDAVHIREAYRPEHIAEADRFHIPPAAMARLMEHLRAKRFMVAAQVHSHPEEAFHSKADDAYAIVRHVGALSFVLPAFARRTTASTFLADTALYELAPGDLWKEVPAAMIGDKCTIVN